MRLSLQIGREYVEEFDRLRQRFIHDPSIKGTRHTLSDRWDCRERSRYLNLLNEDGKLVASARVTRGRHASPRTVLEDWTSGGSLAYLPSGREVMTVTRVCTGDLQNKGLYGALFIAALAYARRIPKVTTVCAVVKHDLDSARRVLRNHLAFQEVPTHGPLFSYDVPGQAVEVIPVYFELSKGLCEGWRYVQDKLGVSGVEIAGLDKLVSPELCVA